MSMIKVKFELINLEEQIEVIENFLRDKNDFSIMIQEYFNLPKDIFNKSNEERCKTLLVEITKLYNTRLKDMENACKLFQETWDKNELFINKALQKIFKCQSNFTSIAYVNLNPIFPRYLQTKSFDVNVDASAQYVLQAGVHEIIHFLWFDIWKKQFPETKDFECEYPEKVWLISELAIDAIFRGSNLKKLLISKPAYDYFYEEKINGKRLMLEIRKLYKNCSIKEFQIKLLDFIDKLNYKNLIR